MSNTASKAHYRKSRGSIRMRDRNNINKNVYNTKSMKKFIKYYKHHYKKQHQEFHDKIINEHNGNYKSFAVAYQKAMLDKQNQDS